MTKEARQRRKEHKRRKDAAIRKADAKYVDGKGQKRAKAAKEKANAVSLGKV